MIMPPAYLEGRCALCGGLINKPYARPYTNIATMCSCGSAVPSDAIGRNYPIVHIRPEQYQEIIDRLSYLESLIEKLLT